MIKKLFDTNKKKLERYKELGFKEVSPVIFVPDTIEKYPKKMSIKEAEKIVKKLSNDGLSLIASG